jgi:hypothetical protein
MIALGSGVAQQGTVATSYGPLHTVPTGRIVSWDISRHLVPGYHRLVPLGQQLGSETLPGIPYASATLFFLAAIGAQFS